MFILRFSEHAQCLRFLAKTKGSFLWKTDHENAFNYLKSSLCNNTLNNHFVKGRQTAIFADAGKNAPVTNTPGVLSGILYQQDENSDSRIVAPNSVR